jgi:signal transduction histidine kinase
LVLPQTHAFTQSSNGARIASPSSDTKEHDTHDHANDYRLLATTQIVSRPVISAVSLAVLLLFVFVGLMFSHSYFPTTNWLLIVAGSAIGLRLLETGFSRLPGFDTATWVTTLAASSICFGLIIPFLLAATTRQFHTHYFGLLLLPVLEVALYFSLPATLVVASVSAASALLWVAYAADFHRPFQLGELLEATTLVLLFFLVGMLVWLIVDLLKKREHSLKHHVEDLKATRAQLVEGEKLAAIGRLASAVAHEIRNPVAIISSAIEAAGSSAFSQEEREDMARIAGIEARRLEKLTTDFLTYAQPGDPPRTEVDAASLSGYLGSIARAQALSKHVQVEIDAKDRCIVYGNEDQLQQALLNLMRNAIDASPEDGRVSVAVSHHANKVKISIENGGPAIPAYAVPKIFEPFFTAKRGGTGLGLSIAQKVIEAHHGELRLECNMEECVVFSLLLPSFPPDPSTRRT